MGRGAEYVHGADGDSLGVGREEALAATRDGREQPEGFVTTSARVEPWTKTNAREADALT